MRSVFKQVIQWGFCAALVFLLVIAGFYYRYGQPIPSSTTKLLLAQYANVKLQPTDVIDHFIVEKSKRILTVYSQQRLLKVYHVSLSRVPFGHKQQQGDKKTPEGRYFIVGKNPGSRYHLSLKISYPNANDQKIARSLGKNPGGQIMLHGLPNHGMLPEALHRKVDWTDGCIALTDAEIKEIYHATQIGAVIDILP